MSVRRETILLEMEDHASREALQAAGAFKVLNSELHSLDGHSTAVSRRLGTLDQRANRLSTSMGKASVALGQTNSRLDAMNSVGLVRFTKQTDTASASIDTFSGRLGVLTQAALVLGPAIAPLGASLVPAVSGLATGMAGAAGAAAAAGLAFAGVGDALDALNEFQLDPTTANLEKLNQALAVLGPAGEGFVRYLDSISGELERLQRTAGSNLFPGLTAGLDSLLALMPRVQVLIGDLAARMGDLAADAGAALAGDQWESFFAFLQTDAAPIFEQFARAAGNVALGLANMTTALSPLSRDFASGMLEASHSFATWTADSSNFQGFIDYVRQVGPQAIDFFTALGEASIALAQAVAPWGSVVLPTLTAALNVFTAIAGSPIGPALTTAALAMLAFNKAAAAGTAIMGRVGPAFGSARSSVVQMRTDLGTVATTWATAGAATERESKKMAAATGRLKGNLAAVGKGAGVIGAVGIAASGAADGIGLTNTAMLGLTGTMAGPWGAAAGAGIGLLLDYKAAQDSAAQAALTWADALDQQTGALTENNLKQVESKITADQLVALQQAGISVTEVTEAVSQGTDAWFAYYESLSGAQQNALLNTDSDFLTGNLNNQLIKMARTADDGAARFDVLGNATENFAEKSSEAARNAARQAAAMDAQRNAARQTAGQFITLGDSLDDATVSLGGWLAEMERSARDLERFGANAQKAARRGLDNGLIASLNEAGPAGARRMAQLANATDAEIARANAAWRRGQAAIENYVNMRVPPKKVTVDISSAVSNVRAVQAVIDSLRGKTVTVTTMQKTIYGAGKMASIAAAQGKADGGEIMGPRYPYGDKILMLGAPGEEVISNRYGQADRFRADRAAGRIPAYADGGTVGIFPSYATGGTVRAASAPMSLERALERHGKRLEVALGKAEKAVDRARDRVDYRNGKRDAVRSAVTGSLNRNWMGDGNEDVWSGATRSGTVAYAQQQWKKQSADSTKLARTIANLRKNGAGDAFIAEILNSSDPLAAAEMFNKQSVAGLRHSQSLYLSATRATASAATSTSAIYADEQKKATAELRTLNQRVHGLEKAINRNHKESERTRKRESSRKAAAKGSRSQHR